MKKALLSLLLCTCISCSAAAQDLCQTEIEGVSISTAKEEAVAAWTKQGYTKQEAFRGMEDPTTTTLNAGAEYEGYATSITHRDQSDSDAKYVRRNFHTVTVSFAPNMKTSDIDAYAAFQKETLTAYCKKLPSYVVELAKSSTGSMDASLAQQVNLAKKNTEYCEKIIAGTFETNSQGYVKMPRKNIIASRDMSQATCFATFDHASSNGRFTMTYYSTPVESK